MSHPGTYVGSPTLGVTGLVVGDSNTAVSFDPAFNQYVVQDDTIAAQTFSAFTIGCILKPNDPTDANQPTFWGIMISGGAQLNLRQDPSGSIGFAFAPGGGFGAQASFNGATDFSPGDVIRCIATWDGTTAKLWVNGALDGPVGSFPNDLSGVGSVPFSSADIIAGGGTGAWVLDNPVAFYFGTDAIDVTGNVSYNGVGDEAFFVADHAATPTEIATIDAAMTGTGSIVSAITALDPYIYWRFGESSGTVANDSGTGNLYTPPTLNDCGPILFDTQGLPRALFRHYAARPRFQTVWKLATDPVTYSLTQPYPLITPEDVRQGNTPIGQQYNAATYLHVYYGPETVDADEAARLVASGIGTVT